MGKSRKKKPAETPSLFDEDQPPVVEKKKGADAPAAKGEEELPPLPPGVPGLPADLDPSWLKALGPETRKPYWADLAKFVAEERKHHTVFPPAVDVFNAFRYTPLDK